MKNLETQRLSYAQACAAQKEHGAKIIDVRSKEENALQAFPETNMNINLYENFKKEIENLDKNTPYICYCMTGGRSQSAAAIMREYGFKATDIIGGIMN